MSKTDTLSKQIWTFELLEGSGKSPVSDISGLLQSVRRTARTRPISRLGSGSCWRERTRGAFHLGSGALRPSRLLQTVLQDFQDGYPGINNELSSQIVLCFVAGQEPRGGGNGLQIQANWQDDQKWSEENAARSQIVVTGRGWVWQVNLFEADENHSWRRFWDGGIEGVAETDLPELYQRHACTSGCPTKIED